MTTVALRKWGNSNGIILPKDIMRTYNLKTDDKVEIVQKDEGILLVIKEPKPTIDDLLAGFDGRITSEELIDWGEPVGMEVW